MSFKFIIQASVLLLVTLVISIINVIKGAGDKSQSSASAFFPFIFALFCIILVAVYSFFITTRSW